MASGCVLGGKVHSTRVGLSVAIRFMPYTCMAYVIDGSERTVTDKNRSRRECS